MRVGDIIDRVQTGYSKGEQSDDSRLSARFVYNIMVTLRSKLIAQEAKKNQKVGQWNYQTIPCVQLIKAPVHECLCLPSTCRTFRTKYQIPEVLTTKDSHMFQSVTSLDGTIQFDEINWSDVKYKDGNKFTSTKPDYYIRNGYLYFTIKSNLEIVTITGLFEDPILAADYPSFCDEYNNPCVEPCEEETTNCNSMLDREFFVDNDLIDTLVKMTIEEVGGWFSKNQEDKSNNAADNIDEQTK